MLEDTRKIWYDLKVQEIVGSIIASAIFNYLTYLIQENIKNGERAPRFHCFSHLGKPGVCITHAELAEYLCTDKSKISYAIDKLKSENLIGMDYVVLETMRAPFFFLEKGCDRLPPKEKYNLRYYYAFAMRILKCFNSASIHGHIAFRNKETETRKGGPLIQSFQLIAENVGLTPTQVKSAIKHLVDSEMLLTTTSQDRRYSMIAVVPDVQKSEGGSSKNMGRVSENSGEGLQKNDCYKEYQDSRVKKVEERTPPFLTKNEEKKEEIIKIKGIQFTESQAFEFFELFDESKRETILLRYSRDLGKGSGYLTGDLMKDLKQIGYYEARNTATDIQVQKDQESQKREEIDNQPIEIIPPNAMAIAREARKHYTEERVPTLAYYLKEIQKLFPTRYKSAEGMYLKHCRYEEFSEQERNVLFKLMEGNDVSCLKRDTSAPKIIKFSTG